MKHFRLSLSGHFFSLLAVAGLAALGVFLDIEASSPKDLSFLLLSIWSFLTMLFWFLLYSGIRLDKGERSWRLPLVVDESGSLLASSSFLNEYFYNAYEMLCTMAFTLCGAVLVGVLVWAKASFETIGFISFFIVAYWIFRRGMKLVLENLGKCQGKYLKAFAVAAAYSISYALVFGAVVYATGVAISDLRAGI